MNAAATRAMQEKAVEVLRQAASKSGSSALALLAMHAADGPFTKVKDLIQKLIESLLAEANAETTKKDFCNTQLSKARQSRDFRLTEARQLNVELSGLETEHDKLVAEMEELDAAIKQGKKDLDETAVIRKK